MNKLSRFKVFLKDRRKKGALRIAKEMLWLLAVKKELPLYYFKHLYKADVDNIRDYFGTQEADLIYTSQALHKHEHTTILSNKLSFSIYFEALGFPTPRLLSFNHDANFIHNNNSDDAEVTS